MARFSAPRPSAALAISIEDRVDLMFRGDDGRTEPLHARELPDGGDYFVNVRNDIAALISDLIVRLKVSPRALFDSIEATVISTPGVVEDNWRLLQLPLWNYPSQRTIRWTFDNKERLFFDFMEVLGDIAEGCLADGGERWTPSARKRFEDTVFVVNDATACAAYEHLKREGTTDFVYLKLHGGANVGVIARAHAYESKPSTFTVNVNHPEAGHSYPMVHRYDREFKGSCVYHHRCYEGLLAVHSLRARAESGSEVFADWAEVLTKLKKAHSGYELEKRLHRALLQDSKMVELMAFYAAQLVYQLAIGPLTPSKVVIGGRTAKPAILAEIRENVVALACGYPLRHELSEAGITGFIEPGLAGTGEKKVIEVEGAMSIAVSQIADPAATKLMRQRRAERRGGNHAGAPAVVIQLQPRIDARDRRK